MIIIPKESKPTLNILIRYYRHKLEETDDRYSAKNFIFDKNGLKICDVSTLSKLENNHNCSLDATYHALIQNLNMKFLLKYDVDQLFHSVNNAILKYAENNQSKDISRLIRDTSNLISEFSESIIYKEYLEIHKIISMYYTNLTFDKELIDKYLELYDIIDESLKPVFLSIVYHYYTRININDKISLEIIKRSLALKSRSIIKYHLMNVYYVRTNQILKIKEQALTNIEFCKRSENKIYLVKAYNLLAFLYFNSNSDKAMEYLNLYVENFDYENDREENLLAIYRNMAHISFFNHEYEKVLELYFKKLYDNTQFLNIFFMYIITSIKNTTNDKEEIKRLISVVRNSSEEQTLFHQTLINFYYNVYFDKPFKDIEKSVQILIKKKEWFIDQEILRHIILDDIIEVCNKYKAYSTYGMVMKHLH